MRELRAGSARHADGATAISRARFSLLIFIFLHLQSKITTARSTGDIAMDLTEICHPQITKLSGSESKNHLIMASNGSLISAGKQRVTQPSVASVSHQVVNDLVKICCSFEIVTHVSLIPGSADSEVSEEQKKEKVAELKKKEKDLQEKLAKKLEELKKICLREAVSFTVLLLLVRDITSSVC